MWCLSKKVQLAKADYTSPIVCVGAGVKSVAAASLQEKHVRPGCGSDLRVPAADQAAGAAATRAVLAAAAASAALTPGMDEGTLKQGCGSAFISSGSGSSSSILG